MSDFIEIDNLSVTFESKGPPVRAVQGVSLSVGQRESYGLVGESGSGKSTILRAICGLAPISGGSIRIGGQALPGRRGKAFSVTRTWRPAGEECSRRASSIPVARPEPPRR